MNFSFGNPSYLQYKVSENYTRDPISPLLLINSYKISGLIERASLLNSRDTKLNWKHKSISFAICEYNMLLTWKSWKGKFVVLEDYIRCFKLVSDL